MSDYFVLNIRNLDSSGEEWLSARAFQFGALGISEVLPFEQPEGEEDVYTKIPDRRAVQVYFEHPPASEFLEELRANIGAAEIDLQGEKNRDWLAEWKKSFKPFALAGGHWVIPSWCEAPAQAQHKIWIDPGMAFGTGTHETTKLVAEQLVVLQAGIKAGATLTSLLDVGTGTGILAILGRQLGIARVRATEIEIDSRRVARENFAANNCADIDMTDLQVENIKEKFSIVTANIIDGVLVRIQNSLNSRVASGGWLIVSGIIAEREPDFLSGYKLPPGVSWSVRQSMGDWLLFAAKF